ncbi:zinc-finger domain-containing protein [Rickettsiales bacterium]|nr:zinc-finger domain-containing protein [Rickettsiales bacterium]
MKPIETIFTNSREVSCRGTKDASTHPLVYLNMGQDNKVICPYCSKCFVFKEASKVNNKKSLN